MSFYAYKRCVCQRCGKHVDIPGRIIHVENSFVSHDVFVVDDSSDEFVKNETKGWILENTILGKSVSLCPDCVAGLSEYIGVSFTVDCSETEENDDVLSVSSEIDQTRKFTCD